MKIKLLLLLTIIPALIFSQKAPKPYGVLPTERQLKWQEMEMYALMHFTPTTFQNKEWGYGDADPKSFNPKNFDADKIVRAVKAGGFKGITVVAKHHDGFCLWPTKTTPYNITASPFRNGKGDLVKEMMEACQRENIKMGIYCSPWDRNNRLYGKPEYIEDVFYPQLKELYSNYGAFFTVFFDGANGGDGYFGGARETRMINRNTYYGFEKIWKMVRNMQPSANIFSDVGPDIRWVGNERGIAASTSWATITPLPDQEGTEASPGNAKTSVLETGTRNGKYWIPAECDVPMRGGWFYHPEQDGQTKSAAQLLDIYYKSVGRGGCLDLGIAPTPEGTLSKEDVTILKEFGDLLKKIFSHNLARSAKIKASNTRGPGFSADHLIDDDRYSYWATEDKITKPEVVFHFAQPVRFNVIRLRENIKLGQRIDSVAIDIWSEQRWKQLATATSIGGNRLIRLPHHVSASKVRLRVTGSPVCVALSDFGLFAEPESLLRSELNNHSKKENKKNNWRMLMGANRYAIDGNVSTIWKAQSPRQAIEVDMGVKKNIKGFTYMPNAERKAGRVDQYIFYYSINGKQWIKAAAGEFANIANNPVLQSVYFKKPIAFRYFKFLPKRLVEGQNAVVAEIGIIEE